MDDLISRQAAIETVRKAQSIGQAHRMLIQLPSAQLAQDLTNGCTDTISRQAVLNLIEQSCCDLEYACDNVALRKEVEALPSAQPGWIPVTERLPERYDNYLITTKDEDTDIGTFHPGFKQWSICDADGFRLTDGVLAWCELPKPWEGGQDGKN